MIDAISSRLAAAILTLALVAVSCGSGGPTAGVDEAIGGTDESAVQAFADVAEPEPEPPPASPPPAPEPAVERPSDVASETSDAIEPAHSFATDVLPIIETVCAQCHSEGGPGATHLELATVADVVASAPAIGWAVQDQWMPPWPASDKSLAFTGDYSLTTEQEQALLGWIDAGAELDVDPTTPIVSTEPVQRIVDPDLVVTSAEPYVGSADVLDDYRCLIFDPGITDTEWILSQHFEPDQVEVVHHAIITLASKHTREQADKLDAADPAVGYSCYAGTKLSPDSVGGYQYRIGGWAPGGAPSQPPEGYAIPMRAGDYLIVQIHYHFDNEPPADLSRMVFDLASDAEVAAAGGSYKTLTGQIYLGPAEIPCYEGDTEPLCDRAKAIERVQRLYGERARWIPEAMLSQCGSTVDDYVDMTDGTAWSTCDRPVTNPGRITSVGAHMHELGLSIRLTLNPDTDEERILLDIPDWDFGWQFGYEPVDEIIIDGNDVIRVDCAWNRERAPYEAVGYILWAEGTGDEMCYSTVVTAPL